MGEMEKVITDCDTAIRKESRAVKAYYLKGQALLELNNVRPSVAMLEEGVCTLSFFRFALIAHFLTVFRVAMRLTKDISVPYVADITSALRDARKRVRFNVNPPSVWSTVLTFVVHSFVSRFVVYMLFVFVFVVVVVFVCVAVAA